MALLPAHWRVPTQSLSRLFSISRRLPMPRSFSVFPHHSFPMSTTLILWWFGVRYTPPPIPVGFQSVWPEFPESSGIWSTFSYIYFTLYGTIPAGIIIEFSPGFHGIPRNPPRLIFIRNNWNNRSHGTSRTNRTPGALPDKRNTSQWFELSTSAPQVY